MYLVDTNCLSELRRIEAGRADLNVAAWAACVPLTQLYLSAITVFEIQLGIARVEPRDPVKARHLSDWLENAVIARFGQRILPVDEPIARAAGRWAQFGPIETADILIAATATVRKMTLVTRNTSDFEKTGVALLNPWLAPR